MNIVRYSVRNPVIVNLVMLAILILGTYSMIELPRELNPKVSFHWVFVIVPYPGVGAEEIEKLITIPIEDALEDIDNIKILSSESNEGMCFIWVQFEEISNLEFKERVSEIESEVNGLDLPEDALDPEIDEFDSDNFIPVISVSLVGDIPESQLRDLSEDLRDDFIEIKGISQVALSGTREREIWVEVDQERLYQHRLSLAQIQGMIAARNINVPAGELTVGRESFLLRTIGEIDSPDGFSKIVVRWDPRGNHLYLGDIATVSDTWKKRSTTARLDGKPAATLSISKKADANSLKVIEKVKAVSEQYVDRLPMGAKLVFTNDNGIWMLDLLGKLQTNAVFGLIFVVLILYLFLGLRNAFVTAVGIPIAFMATFLFLSQIGQTMNGSSLFGLILVLGMVVDDAIIVVENCYRHLQRGLSRKEAAIVGAREVFWPVITATLTTCAAFLPLVLMSGIMGKFMRVIPIVVCVTLAASMIEVFFIAPSHFAEWGGTGGRLKDGALLRKFRRIYTKVLIWVIRRRYLVGPALLLLVIIMAAMIPLVGVELFSGDEWSQFSVFVTMPTGTRLEDTDKIIKRIEAETNDFPDGEIHAVIANSGIMQADPDWTFADHVGQVIVDLVEPEFRERSMDEIMDDLRERVKGIAGPTSVRLVKASGGPPIGKPVEVKVKGKYLDELEAVTQEVKAILAAIPGVHDITDDSRIGRREIRLIVNEDRAAIHGLSVAQVAMEVRASLDGVVATVYREGDEEVDVRVKLAGLEAGGIDMLKSLSIMTPTGALVRLENLCSMEIEPTLYRIKRFNGERAITVSADIDKRETSAVKVSQELSRRYEVIAARYPGYRLDFRGEMKEFMESFNELGRLFLVGVILIFTILGAQFKSVRQSFLILLTIPFGFIGSMIGLLIIQQPFSIVTLYGMVALAGIAVNDAIVMVTFINNERARGSGKWRSIIDAGRIRLRPIILTSVTTIIGLLPMAIGLGGKSASWSPLANTIIWGLAAATMLTLLVVPTVYSILVDDWMGLVPLRKRLRKRKELRSVVV